jgi:carbonic anhydrase
MPAKKLSVLACMDARVAPARLLGLQEGDAHVIRNAGGVVTEDAIRSLAISQNLLGTEEIVLIQHTDCGMLNFTDDEFKRQLEEKYGVRPDWDSEAFSDLEDNVRASLDRIKESPFIPNKHSIRGFIYEVETGKLREVK